MLSLQFHYYIATQFSHNRERFYLIPATMGWQQCPQKLYPTLRIMTSWVFLSVLFVTDHDRRKVRGRRDMSAGSISLIPAPINHPALVRWGNTSSGSTTLFFTTTTPWSGNGRLRAKNLTSSITTSRAGGMVTARRELKLAERHGRKSKTSTIPFREMRRVRRRRRR